MLIIASPGSRKDAIRLVEAAMIKATRMIAPRTGVSMPCRAAVPP